MESYGSSSSLSVRGGAYVSSSSSSVQEGVVSEDFPTKTSRKPPKHAAAKRLHVITRHRSSSLSSSSSSSLSSFSSYPSISWNASETWPSIARGGVARPFPWKLHDMLEDQCATSERDPLVVTWNRDGTAFCVLNTKAFVQTILPRYVYQPSASSQPGPARQSHSHYYSFVRLQLLCANQVRLLSETTEFVGLYTLLHGPRCRWS
jgi:hypothetical protein